MILKTLVLLWSIQSAPRIFIELKFSDPKIPRLQSAYCYVFGSNQRVLRMDIRIVLIITSMCPN